jgi:trimeric autotransporter adhesin
MKNQRSCVSMALAVCVAANAFAQCTPAWDGSIGTPGISGGYIAPIVPWNDGTGEALYIGGSFSGLPAATGGTISLVAKWNKSANTWSRLGSGTSTGFTNGFITSLTPHRIGTQNVLMVGGFYDTAGGVPGTASLAAWTGTQWQAIGTNWTGSSRSSVWSMASWNGLLYIGGGTGTPMGNITFNGIATWNGSTFATPGSGMGGGFSPTVFAMKVFNDGSGEKLYVGGRFASMGGISGMIARWTGSAWEPVGTGLFSNSPFGGIEAMAVFDPDGAGPERESLYVGGWDPTPVGLPVSSVCRWDGTRWTNVGQYLGGRTTSLAVYDDGSGPALYAGGTAQPAINYIAKLTGNQWVAADGGVTGPGLPDTNFPSVFGLGVWENRLYAGGNFTVIGGRNARGIAFRTTCRTACIADFNRDGTLDFFDYLDFVQAFADENPRADINGNGTIDFFDYLDFVQAFDAGCP